MILLGVAIVAVIVVMYNQNHLPVPVAEKLNPPGTCQEDEHQRYQDNVDHKCKTIKFKCKKNHSPEEIQQNIALFDVCISARRLIMDKCYKGGDETHIGQLNDLYRGRENCVKLMPRSLLSNVLNKEYDSNEKCENL